MLGVVSFYKGIILVVTRVLLNALVLACLPMPVRFAMCFISGLTVLRSKAFIISNVLESELLPVQLFNIPSHRDGFLSCEKNKTCMNAGNFKKIEALINVVAMYIKPSYMQRIIQERCGSE